MSTVFIALSGKKQVGKDTTVELAKTILITAGKTVGVTAFAEPLKAIAINVLGVPHDLAYGTNEDKEKLTHVLWDTFPLRIRWKYRERWYMPLRSGQMTVRELLQVMGTDIFREMFEGNVWANAPFRRDWSGYDVVFITDCRFPNEKIVVEERGGTVIRLERDTGFKDDHASETSLDGVSFNRVYHNNGTIEELREFIHNTLHELELI